MVVPVRALVTGSAGFVGRHMAARLAEDGYDVIHVDPNEDPRAGGLRWPMDCRTWFQTEGTYCEVDLVVHCAAVVGGRTMIDGAPLLLAAEDLSIDADLFRWILARKAPPRIVYYSSSAAYPVELQTGGIAYRIGNDNGVYADRLVESDIDLGRPMLPDATYGWVKLTGERLAAEANALGIPVHVFRPFSGYGTDQALDYPFPAIIERARQRQDPLTLWGPLNSTRDWIHIDDVVEGTLAWVDSGRLEPVNLCTGVATEFGQLALDAAHQVNERDSQTRLEIPNYAPHVWGDESKPTGVLCRVGDPSLMHEVFTPDVTLTEGIRRALHLPLD